MARLIYGNAVLSGNAVGRVLVSRDPLSFWGGYDHQTGEITDRRHPLTGQIASGRILAVPFSRGSSTTTAVLLEAVRARTAPAAIVTTTVDSFFALASVVASEMYGRPIPLVVVAEEDFQKLNNNQLLQISENGKIEILKDA